MGMLTIQEYYGNLEEHKLELKRYKRNGDEVDAKEEEVGMAFLSKKLQRIFIEKRNRKKRKTLPQKKNQDKHE